MVNLLLAVRPIAKELPMECALELQPTLSDCLRWDRRLMPLRSRADRAPAPMPPRSTRDNGFTSFDVNAFEIPTSVEEVAVHPVPPPAGPVCNDGTAVRTRRPVDRRRRRDRQG